MEVQEIYRGRLIDHIQFVVKDLQKSKMFYRAVASALKIPMGGEGPAKYSAQEIKITF